MLLQPHTKASHIHQVSLDQKLFKRAPKILSVAKEFGHSLSVWRPINSVAGALKTAFCTLRKVTYMKMILGLVAQCLIEQILSCIR